MTKLNRLFEVILKETDAITPISPIGHTQNPPKQKKPNEQKKNLATPEEMEATENIKSTSEKSFKEIFQRPLSQ